MDRWFRLWIEKSEVIEKLCAKMTELFENIRKQGRREVGYRYKNWISNQFTDEKEVEYCPKDSIEEDSSEVLHEDPVVQGVGGLLTPFKVTVCSIFSIAQYTYK